MIEEDPIIAEIHLYRREHAAKFGNNIDAMFADLMQKQEALRRQGREFISMPPRMIPPGAVPMNPLPSPANSDFFGAN